MDFFKDKDIYRDNFLTSYLFEKIEE